MSKWVSREKSGMVFKTPSGDYSNYWLATRGVDAENSAGFGSGVVDCASVYSCYSTYWNDGWSLEGSYVVIPVVCLKNEFPAKIGTPSFE